MKIIAVMNEKGGIGKTMTASSIAWILGEEEEKNVLIVDADQQGNISRLYERFEPEGRGMSELLEDHRAAGGHYKTNDLIYPTPYGHIDIIPANGYLMRTNMKLLLLEQGDQVLRFRAAMEEVKDAYDYCIVDCGLILDMAVTNVLAAADLVIVPVKIGGFEIEAVDNLAEQLDGIGQINDRIEMKLLMTMRQKNKTSLQVQEWLETGSGYECFQTAVRRSITAEKSTMAHLPLPVFSKRGGATQDYRAVTHELMEEWRDQDVH